MKEEICDALSCLIGYPFSNRTRAGATECLQFGFLYKNDHKGIRRAVGKYQVHLQCPWRFTNEHSLLVGSDDLCEQPNEEAPYDEDFNWDVQGGNLRDVKMAQIAASMYVVDAVNADNYGGFKIKFTNGICLTAFSALSTRNEYNELWRLMDNSDDDKPHFVVNATGIDKDF
jgi:hypothetical protein